MFCRCVVSLTKKTWASFLLSASATAEEVAPPSTPAEPMEIAWTVDSWRYQQRLRDAAEHSRELIREYPLTAARALFRPTPRGANRCVPDHSSRETYRHLLEQVAGDEYNGRQHQLHALALTKIDPAQSIRALNVELSRRLKKTLTQHIAGSTAGKITRRHHADGFSTLYGRKTRALEPYGMKDKYTMKHAEEIEELRARLAGYQIKRLEGADDVFYKSITDRETSELIDEVLREEIWDLVEETYEEAYAETQVKDLPPEQLQIVNHALHEGPESDVLIQKYNVDITRRHLQCLLPLQWLNDEVINFYINLLSDRDEEMVKNGILPKRSHFFNSFFYTKVSEGGYNFVNVRRWTRKIDIFAMDKIFVPVNIKNTHWCMAVIFMTEKRIQYYDSMDGPGQHCLEVLFKYLHDEMEHKKKEKFNPEGWKLVTTARETPQQQNGSDCGVFSCMFADYLSRNLPLSFSQNDMEFHRHRMVLHIVQGTLPIDEDL